MDVNTPMASKAKAAIDDHLGWAQVHLTSLAKVEPEISNDDFIDRCGDVLGELWPTLPHFSALCPRPVRIGKNTVNKPATNFMEIDTSLAVDPDLTLWVENRLHNVEELTRETSMHIGDRDGVGFPFELQGNFPAEWLQKAEMNKPYIFVPGLTREIDFEPKPGLITFE